MTKSNLANTLWGFKQIRWGVYILSTIIILVVSSYFVLTGILSTDGFNYPKQDHLHFRLQYIFQGQAEDFGSPRYQVDYVKDVCNGALTESPIHFHDQIDQIVHIHWQNMRGGDVLKFYGLNYVGGLDSYMGFKMDELFNFLPKITPVPIHSQSLPKPKPEDNFYIYTGEKDNFEKKDWNNFLKQDLETFFGVQSQISLKQNNYFNLGSINAEAHAGEEHATQTEAEQHELEVKEQEQLNNKNNIAQEAESKVEREGSLQISEVSEIDKTEEELKQINNLIGNVVIFVQKDEPTKEQVQARFDNLEPLGVSVCGG